MSFPGDLQHTEVVRRDGLIEAQPCWEPRTASEDRRQPAALASCSHSVASNSKGSVLCTD